MKGFTLIELLVVLGVIAILLAGAAMPLSAQVEVRRIQETRRQLDEAREALLGFAATQGRLPCPATPASRGEEAFAAGGHAGNGRCALHQGGLLPAATLGLSPLDREGFLRDAWETEDSRIRYAVFGAPPIEGVEYALTRTNGLQAATLAGLGNAPHLLSICLSATGVTSTTCGPAANQLTRRAAFVLASTGPHALPARGPDEAANLDTDGVFIAHPPTATAANPFDDLVTWVPATILASRMIAAGRLP